MGDKIKYPWQQAVVDAFLAAPGNLPAKINIAERAISARLSKSGDLDVAERIALNDALRSLQVLITEARSRAAGDGSAEKSQEDPQNKLQKKKGTA